MVIPPHGLLLAVIAVPLWACAQSATAEDLEPPPVTRSFEFEYSGRIHGLTPGKTARVWIPVPPTSSDQNIRELGESIPGAVRREADATYGNRILHFEATVPASGTLSFSKTYKVDRHEVRRHTRDNGTELTAEQRRLFLSANSRVPVSGRPLTLLEGMKFSKEPLGTARRLYDLVEKHVEYDKSRPGYGRGDSTWVCESRFGNCSDFHSLFISLARARNLPARFEIGFPLPRERGTGNVSGYHCWAQFFIDEQGWIPVDISEADKHPELREYFFGNLTEDRIAFTIGRDITLAPKQDGGPLNFFIYPYVEVDRRPWPEQQIDLRCSYADEKR